MRLVVLESPYAGNVDEHVAYARAAMYDSLQRGEAPLASHILYAASGVLNDDIGPERLMRMAAGFEWGRRADATVVYTDLGISGRMQRGIDHAEREGRPVEFRSLYPLN